MKDQTLVSWWCTAAWMGVIAILLAAMTQSNAAASDLDAYYDQYEAQRQIAEQRAKVRRLEQGLQPIRDVNSRIGLYRTVQERARQATEKALKAKQTAERVYQEAVQVWQRTPAEKQEAFRTKYIDKRAERLRHATQEYEQAQNNQRALERRIGTMEKQRDVLVKQLKAGPDPEKALLDAKGKLKRTKTLARMGAQKIANTAQQAINAGKFAEAQRTIEQLTPADPQRDHLQSVLDASRAIAQREQAERVDKVNQLYRVANQRYHQAQAAERQAQQHAQQGQAQQALQAYGEARGYYKEALGSLRNALQTSQDEDRRAKIQKAIDKLELRSGAVAPDAVGTPGAVTAQTSICEVYNPLDPACEQAAVGEDGTPVGPEVEQLTQAFQDSLFARPDEATGQQAAVQIPSDYLAPSRGEDAATQTTAAQGATAAPSSERIDLLGELDEWMGRDRGATASAPASDGGTPPATTAAAPPPAQATGGAATQATAPAPAQPGAGAPAATSPPAVTAASTAAPGPASVPPQATGVPAGTSPASATTRPSASSATPPPSTSRVRQARVLFVEVQIGQDWSSPADGTRGSGQQRWRLSGPLKWRGNQFSVEATQVDGYVSYRSRMQGSVSADGNTLTTVQAAQEKYFDGTRLESSVKFTLSNLPLRVFTDRNTLRPAAIVVGGPPGSGLYAARGAAVGRYVSGVQLDEGLGLNYRFTFPDNAYIRVDFNQ